MPRSSTPGVSPGIASSATRRLRVASVGAAIAGAAVAVACFAAPDLAADPSGTWSQLLPSGDAPRSYHLDAMVFDSARDRLIVGGERSSSLPIVNYSNQALALSGSPQWTGLPPFPYDASGSIYDPVRDCVVSFAGWNAFIGPLQDLRMLALAPAPGWTTLPATGTPPRIREHPATVYDPLRDRMLVYGGGADNDLWELSLAGTPAWTELSPTGTPPPKGERSAVYDPVRDRLLVYEGFYEGWSAGNRVWSLDLAGTPAWSELAPGGAPPPVDHACVAYDSARDRLLVRAQGGGLWALSLAAPPAWTALAPAGPSPPAGFPAAGIYGAPRDRWLLQVMTTWTDLGPTETWALDFGEPLAIGPSPGLALALEGPNPARGVLRFEAMLPDEGPATLEVFDASGRRVAARTLEGPGRIPIAFGDRARLAPGLYFARLSRAGRSVSDRAVVIR